VMRGSCLPELYDVRLLDPLTSTVGSLAEAKAMTLEAFAAEKAFLPKYR